MMLRSLVILACVVGAAIHTHAQQATYGTDCSFPIHRKELVCEDEAFARQRQRFYEDFMSSCRKHFGRKARRCDDTEDDRIAMNVRQPQSMVVRTILVEVVLHILVEQKLYAVALLFLRPPFRITLPLVS